MNSKIVAIQGTLGSNHHKVAREIYSENVQLKECFSFDSLVDAIISENANEGVMAIENTIAGSIIPNYALIDRYKLQIVGETYLNIHHHLMVLEGETLETITEVCSHPMALLQCKEFFKLYPHIRLIEDSDTAAVAKRIAKKKLRGVAAIAPKLAASVFGLTILRDNIQTITKNETRFVTLSKNQNTDNEFNKASLKFQLNHKRGSLATILNVLSDCNMNLTKIQSLPVIETPWKYSFFVDVTFSDKENYNKAIAILALMAEDFKILGTYKNGRK